MYTRVDPEKLADAQAIAQKLVSLPKEALLYIAGYAEGCRDKPEDNKVRPPTNRPA